MTSTSTGSGPSNIEVDQHFYTDQPTIREVPPVTGSQAMSDLHEGSHLNDQYVEDGLFPNIDYDILPESFKKAICGHESKVELYNNCFSEGQVEEQVVTIAAFLRADMLIKEVTLGMRIVNDGGAFALAQALETNSSLLLLNLGVNNITHIGCNALADALVANSSLEELWLDSNPIGDQGIQYLAKSLQSNYALVDLVLSATNCGNQGAFALSEALKVNAGLNEVHLDFNNIDDEGAEALAQAMMVNPRVELKLHDNKLTLEKKQELKERFGGRFAC
ncbi:hypothetical protein P9112_009341 [Eukaryota sp. TZLM1-RC]